MYRKSILALELVSFEVLLSGPRSNNPSSSEFESNHLFMVPPETLILTNVGTAKYSSGGSVNHPYMYVINHQNMGGLFLFYQCHLSNSTFSLCPAKLCRCGVASITRGLGRRIANLREIWVWDPQGHPACFGGWKWRLCRLLHGLIWLSGLMLCRMEAQLIQLVFDRGCGLWPGL